MAKGVRLHQRCGTEHHVFGRCPDGFKEHTYVTTGARQAPRRPRASVAREAEAAIAAAPQAPASAELRHEMAQVITADQKGEAKEPIPEGFSLVNGILVPTDPAKIAEIMEDNRRYALAQEHAEAERASGMMLPLPKELRRANSEGANALLAQIGEVKKKQAEYRTKDVTVDQALATSGLIQDVIAARQKRESAAAQAPKPAELRAEGEYPWTCVEPKCRTRFQSLSIEAVRRKARAEPQWRLCCPKCGSLRVIQAEVVEGVA